MCREHCFVEAVCCVILISARAGQIVKFIANSIRCDKWMSVNLTRLIFIVSMM
jgi:hypothetical protein